LECAIEEVDKKGDEKNKKKRFIELWLNDPSIRKYENYVFTPPPYKVEEYEYNTWTNFEIRLAATRNEEVALELLRG
jgi:hypothetical protein